LEVRVENFATVGFFQEAAAKNPLDMAANSCVPGMEEAAVLEERLRVPREPPEAPSAHNRLHCFALV